ncbi:MAG: D-aminoacyl-tRNA deacylase [Sulfolobales archaeon]
MMISFAFSTRDLAGSGIADRLIRRLGLVCNSTEDPRVAIVCRSSVTTVIGFREDVIFLEYLDQYFPDSDLVAILSRHSSSAEIPSLTIHYTGNPRRESSFGGRPMELSYTRPSVSNAFLRNLREVVFERGISEYYKVSFEATHHGPTSNKKPIVFLEIGSSEDKWRDPLLHEVWVDAIMRTLSGRNIECSKVAVGVGGPHYSERFTRMCFEEKYCFSHIIPRYAVKELSTSDLLSLISQAIEKTLERVSAVVVERKSVDSKTMKSIENTFSREDLEVVRI